jgi:hypothetical protein
MAEADNGNGRITTAVIGEKLDGLSTQFVEFRAEMRAVVQMLTEAKTHHDAQAKEHCHQLYNSEGQSRIQSLESRVRPLEERTQTGESRRWDVQTILLSAVIALGSTVITLIISNTMRR